MTQSFPETMNVWFLALQGTTARPNEFLLYALADNTEDGAKSAEAALKAAKPGGVRRRRSALSQPGGQHHVARTAPPPLGPVVRVRTRGLDVGNVRQPKTTVGPRQSPPRAITAAQSVSAAMSARSFPTVGPSARISSPDT